MRLSPNGVRNLLETTLAKDPSRFLAAVNTVMLQLVEDNEKMARALITMAHDLVALRGGAATPSNGEGQAATPAPTPAPSGKVRLNPDGTPMTPAEIALEEQMEAAIKAGREAGKASPPENLPPAGGGFGPGGETPAAAEEPAPVEPAAPPAKPAPAPKKK